MNIFKVVNGQLFHIVKETVNTGSKKFFKIEFVFDNSWEDFSQLRFAEFYQNIDDTHIRVAIDENGIVEVPTDIICHDLPLYVGVSAENIDGNIISNTNFLPIAVNYGANSTENIHYPETENNFYALFSPNTSLRYLRVNNGVLEYSNDNKQWFAVSGLVSGGISEEKVAEIVEGKTKNLPTTIDAQIEENTIKLTIELKDKNGNTVSSKTIQIPQQNLADYVKFTDYASQEKAGVIKVDDSGYGLELLGNGKSLRISPATKKQIDDRQEEYYAWPSNCKPIVPATIGYAVRQVLTNPKFESETYTEEEQKKACAWLGAVKTATANSTYEQVYVIGKDGTAKTLLINNVGTPLGNTIVKRDGEGGIAVNPAPTMYNQATAKQYVDGITPLTLEMCPEFGKPYAEIENAFKEYVNNQNTEPFDDNVYRIWYGYYNKTPQKGDVFISVGTSNDGISFTFRGEILYKDAENGWHFAISDLVPLSPLVLIHTISSTATYEVFSETNADGAYTYELRPDVSSFSRTPKKGEIYWGTVGLASGYEGYYDIASFTAQVDRFENATDSKISAVSTLLDVSLFHKAQLDYDVDQLKKQVADLQAQINNT